MHLILHFHQHEGHQCSRSNERYHAGMRDAIRLAIRYSLEFHRDDFKTMQHSIPDEYDYALMCGSERGRSNMSAAIAYENFKDRKPFLIADEGVESPTRVYVGRKFKWMGNDVTCTSFDKTGECFVACTYKLDADGTYSRNVERVLKIKHADIREEKKRTAAVTEIVAMAKAVPAESLKALGEQITNKCGHCKPSKMTMAELAWLKELIVPAVKAA